MWLVFHRVDAGASSFVSTGIHYQDTTRAIKKALSFDKVFVKVGKSLSLMVKRCLSLEPKTRRAARAAAGSVGMMRVPSTAGLREFFMTSGIRCRTAGATVSGCRTFAPALSTQTSGNERLACCSLHHHCDKDH